jgi:hypothetical protein
MTLKSDIEHLLAKGLSGKEAGRLAVAELVEIDHGRPGCLSQKDVLALKAGLRTPEASADYQRMISLYLALPLLLCEARVVSQQTEEFLLNLQRELERYWISARVADLARGCGLAVSPACDGSGDTAELSVADPAYCLAALGDVMQTHFLEEHWAKNSGRPLAELLGRLHEAATSSACVLLAYLAVIAQASAVAGIASPACWPRVPRELDALLPQPEPRDLLAEVREAAEVYNDTREAVAVWRDVSGCPELPLFELDELAPDPGTVEVLHIRVAHGLGRTGLGDDWWREQP